MHACQNGLHKAVFEGWAAAWAAQPSGTLRLDRFLQVVTSRLSHSHTCHVSPCRLHPETSFILQVAVFEGRAAVPAARLSGALRLNRFRKAFFLHPDSEDLLGRVDVGKGALGDALYPLYFKATVGSTIVPGEPQRRFAVLKQPASCDWFGAAPGCAATLR